MAQRKEQVRLENDASHVDILGKFGRLFDTFGALGEGGGGSAP